MINGTRAPFGPNFSDDAWTTTIANSNYNPLRVRLRHTTGRLSFLAAYAYSKSMDNASSLSASALNPISQQLSRSLYGFDMTHNFAVSYNYVAPVERPAHNGWPRLTNGWRLSGVIHFAAGFPVPISEIDNIFNYAQFQTSDGDISSAAFGLVTGANDPRIGQVALKLLF